MTEADLDHVAVGRLRRVAGLGQSLAGIGQGPVGAVARHEGRLLALGVDDGVLDTALAGAQPADLGNGLVDSGLVQPAVMGFVTVVSARAHGLILAGRLGIPAHLKTNDKTISYFELT